MNRARILRSIKIGGIVLALAVLAGASAARWNSERRQPTALAPDNGDDSAQDRRPEEPIPPPTPPPTLTAEEIALEQTSQGYFFRGQGWWRRWRRYRLLRSSVLRRIVAIVRCKRGGLPAL